MNVENDLLGRYFVVPICIVEMKVVLFDQITWRIEHVYSASEGTPERDLAGGNPCEKAIKLVDKG
jgi:hypothetical protein